MEVKESKVEDKPVLGQQDVLRHLNMFYTKFINYREIENDVLPVAVNANPLKFFVSYLFARYETKDLVMKKLKDIVSSTMVLYPSDDRIMQFATLIGLTNISFTPEEIFIYAKLLKTSQVPLDTIFGNKLNAFLKYEDAYQMIKKYFNN